MSDWNEVGLGWVGIVGWVDGRENDHTRYEKVLPDGEVLRTKISRGGTGIDDPGLWKHVLRDQLRVSEDEFWAVLAEKRPANRGAPPLASGVGEEEIPTYVAEGLLKVGLHDDQIMQISADKALARLHEVWAQPTDSP